MKTFMSLSDLDKLADDDPAYPVVKQLLESLIADGEYPDQPYNPDDHGYITLVEPGDVDRELDDIDMPHLTDIMWVGVARPLKCGSCFRGSNGGDSSSGDSRMTTQTTVKRMLVPEDQRLTITEKLFGTWFPTRIEPVVFTFAERLSNDYKGGYWEFHTLSNGGFLMTPAGDRLFHVICENQFEGDLSADALGITACLYAYSNLSFAGPDAFADICFDHYHWLKDYALEHHEVESILSAID